MANRKKTLWEKLVSNESIRAIVSGLDLSRGDSIISVCGGGGDAIFALAERASKILVLDYDVKALKYFERRMSLLDSGNYGAFLETPRKPENDNEYDDLQSRNRYFSQSRLKRIRRNLRDLDLSIVYGSIFESQFPLKVYNKINLSNCLSYETQGNGESGLKRLKGLKGLATIIPVGGLIYTSDGNYTFDRAKVFGEDPDSALTKFKLKVNEELTKKATELQEDKNGWLPWVPRVFEKTP